MAMQTSQYSAGQVGGSNPLDIVLKHLDTVPNMIYGALVIVLITFVGQVSPTVSSYADSALGRVLGVALILAVTQLMGWTYGLLTALAFLLVVHSSPRLAATSFDNFEDLKRNEAKGTKWFVEKILGENPHGIETDDVTTHPVQDDSEVSMNRSHSGR
jgi:hypothetical protein